MQLLDKFVFRENDPAILVPFLAYLLGVFVIAYFAHKRLSQSNFESEYFVGSRSFGAWVLAMSWVATLASGGTFLGYPSLVYSYGWSMALWVSGSAITALVGLGIIGKRINRLARQTGALTLVDLLRTRFRSQAIGYVYAMLIVFVTSIYLVAQFVAGARILEAMLGTTYFAGLVLFAVSVVAYTTYGGFRAVAWTDTLQGIVMIIGIVLLVPFAISAVGGLENATISGPRPLAERVDPVAAAAGEATQKHAYLYGPGPNRIPKGFRGSAAASDDETDERSLDPLTVITDPWLVFSMGISFFMLRSLGGMLMPTTVPRMLAFKDTKSLRRALLLLAPYFLLMYGSSLITMNCAHSLDLGLAPNEADIAVPTLAKAVAPMWLAGLLIAAPFAAVMSTVDSALLVISATVVRDLVQKTHWPNLSTKAMKRLSYCTTAGAGMLVFCVSLNPPTFLQPLVIRYVAICGSALFWPSLATIYWKRATNLGILSGLIGGLATFTVFDLFRPLDEIVMLHPFVYGFIASGLFVFLGSKLTQRQNTVELLTFFGAASSPSNGSAAV